MTHDELIRTPEYWTTMIQFELFEKVEEFLKENKMTRTQLADMLGVSKGYVTQILNGDYDHRISKLVELSLAIGFFPQFNLKQIGEDKSCQKHIHKVIENIHSLSRSINHTAFLYKPKEKDNEYSEEFNKVDIDKINVNKRSA